MKFTSIPEAYSSFREPLIYAFNTESATPHDVELKIINRTTGEEIGRKRLYNVTSGEVDIAPYLRSAARPSLPTNVEECGEVDVGTTIKVVVEAEGLDYDEEDASQQAYLSEITKYNVTKIN